MTQIFSIGVPIVIGVIVGVVLTGVLLKRYRIADKLKNKIATNDNNKQNYDTLIKDQVVCDTISIEDLKPWFEAQKALHDNAVDITFMLAKPTFDVSAMVGLDKPPVDLDVDHNLLQAVILNKNKVVAIRLISYNFVPLNVKQKLDKGPVFIK